MPDFVFNGNDLTRLARLMYSPAIPATASSAGAHRVRRAGQGTDFLDYRAYVPGDDVRRIDWTVFARLRQPFVRVLEHEQALYVNILVDLSRSMATGQPRTKAALACQLACGLAYIALNAGDHVTYATFASQLSKISSGLHGRPALSRMVQSLKDQPIGTATNVVNAAREFCRSSRHRGLAVVISDFLNGGDPETVLMTLLAHRNKVLMIQVLDSRDWGEGLSGSLRLIDSETGRSLDVAASPERLAQYRQHVYTHQDRIKSCCLRRGQSYLYARTEEDYLLLLVRGLREGGLTR